MSYDKRHDENMMALTEHAKARKSTAPDAGTIAAIFREVAKRIGARPWDTPIHKVLEELADALDNTTDRT